MTYNHKEAIENLTPEQYQENLEWAYKGLKQAIKRELVTCRGCKLDFNLYLLFRCYFCGSYYCSKCAQNHFGSRSLK